MGNDHCELVGFSGEEHICFSRSMMSQPAFGNAHIGLGMINRLASDVSNLVNEELFIGIPRDVGEFKEVNIFHKYRGYALSLQCCMISCNRDIFFFRNKY